jgi:beta-phosphoglucomutase
MHWIRRFDLFLFDFDGLLVNTEHVHFQAYVNALAARGLKLDWTFGRFCELAHLNARAIRESICAQFPDLAPDWQTLYEEKKNAYFSLIRSGKIELMPGVEPLLRSLEASAIRRCVVTNALLDQTLLIRSQIPLLESIPHWITRETYEKPKPDSECYLRAIALHGKPGDRIIGFEDSVRGLQALAGTPALPVLICPSHHPLLPMALPIAALHFSSLEEIADEAFR